MPRTMCDIDFHVIELRHMDYFASEMAKIADVVVFKDDDGRTKNIKYPASTTEIRVNW